MRAQAFRLAFTGCSRLLGTEAFDITNATDDADRSAQSRQNSLKQLEMTMRTSEQRVRII